MGDAKTILACALRGKPCKRISIEEMAKVGTGVCHWPRPERREDEVFLVFYEIKLRGEPYKPLCDACPLHELESKPARHLTVVGAYTFVDEPPPLPQERGSRFPVPLGQTNLEPPP